MPPPNFAPLYVQHEPLEVTLEAAVVARGDGSTYRHHRLRTGHGPGGAVVLAVRAGMIMLTSSWRVAVGREMLELPRGWAELRDSESAAPLVAAGVRELLEETGYGCETSRQIGSFLIDTTIYPQPVGVVLCTLANEPDKSRVTDGEARQTVWVPIAELDSLIDAGCLSDGITLAAIAVWRAAGSALM